MSLETVQVAGKLSKWRLGFSIFAISVILLSFLMGIVNSVGYGLKTNDWHPLAKNTLGKLMFVDMVIKEDIDLLKQNQPEKFATTLKAEIGHSLILLVVFFLLLYLLIKQSFRWRISEAEETGKTKLGYVLITLFLLLTSTFVYNIIMFKASIPVEQYRDLKVSETFKNTYPFVGIVSLAQNWDVIGNWGTLFTGTELDQLSRMLNTSNPLQSTEGQSSLQPLA